MITRFCPSPTGSMHLGNLRTALFSYLLADADENFFVRIEDTDTDRSRAEFSKEILQQLTALKLTNPNTVVISQSDLQDFHQQCLDTLLEKQLAYKCYCTKSRLQELAQSQKALKQPPRYDGKCKSNPEISSSFCVRFNTQHFAKTKVEFCDLLKQEQSFDLNNFDDFVIFKSDNTPSFIFANAIDDAKANVDVVLRGDDHLSNTPKQICILQALGFKVPTYLHLPLIHGHDNQKLSKRNGSKSVQELLLNGYAEIALLNYLFRLGHTCSNSQLLSLKQMRKLFKTSNLVKSYAKFDIEQLNYFQKLHWQGYKNDIEVFERKYINELTFATSRIKELFIQVAIANFFLPVQMHAFYHQLQKEYFNQSTILQLKPYKKAIEFALTNIDAIYDLSIINKICQNFDYKKRDVFIMLRLIFTESLKGPTIKEILHLHSKEQIKQKLTAINHELF